jgi:hypothetical protein
LKVATRSESTIVPSPSLQDWPGALGSDPADEPQDFMPPAHRPSTAILGKRPLLA